MSHQIRAELRPTEFCHEPHLVIAVDDVALDQLIVDATGDQQFLGLIPAWLSDLSDAAEREVVWNRVQRSSDANIIVPVLMCPDDLDFSCTIIVADTTFDADVVTWRALGVDAGGSQGLPASIGSVVDWLDGLGPFHFARADYDSCIDRFRLQISGSGFP